MSLVSHLHRNKRSTAGVTIKIAKILQQSIGERERTQVAVTLVGCYLAISDEVESSVRGE